MMKSGQIENIDAKINLKELRAEVKTKKTAKRFFLWLGMPLMKDLS